MGGQLHISDKSPINIHGISFKISDFVADVTNFFTIFSSGVFANI